MPDFSQQSYVVTGGTQGLGLRIATDLVEAGASVLFCGRSEANGNAAAKDLSALGTKTGARAHFIRADLATVEGCVAVMDAAEQLFDGELNGLVNAAASTARGTIDDTSAEDFDAMMALNVRAPFLLMQGAMPLLRACGGGGIVNIGSVSAHGGQPKLAAYCTSKGALATLTKNVAFAVRGDKIRVTCLNVGWMATPAEHAVQAAEGQSVDWLAQADAAAPLGQILRPAHVSAMVLHLLGAPGELITGAIIELNQEVVGGFA